MAQHEDKSASSSAKAKDTKKASRIPHASRQRAANVLLLLLVCATVGFGGGYLGSGSRQQLSNSDQTINRADQAQAKSQSQLISAIAQKVSPSVVSVNVVGQSQATSFFSGYQQRSAGTGIIISDDGYIVTNRHVVPDGTRTVSITLSDGSELTDVSVVGRTNESDPLDVAFLKIGDAKGKKLQKAVLGDSSHVKVGDKVIAIGNALGQFQNTVTDGIISGFGRNLQAGGAGGDVETLQNLIQTDAAINEGNSGGPLLNIDGEVIGINTAVAGGSAQNIGFAIPINDVSGLITSVLEKGKLERPYLGVRYVALTDDSAYYYGLSVKRGAYILPSQRGLNSILPDSPADKAGLKQRDIITKVDGTAIDATNSLTSLIGRGAVGDTIQLTVVRGNEELTVDVQLQATPSD